MSQCQCLLRPILRVAELQRDGSSPFLLCGRSIIALVKLLKAQGGVVLVTEERAQLYQVVIGSWMVLSERTVADVAETDYKLMLELEDVLKGVSRVWSISQEVEEVTNRWLQVVAEKNVKRVRISSKAFWKVKKTFYEEITDSEVEGDVQW